MLTHETLHPTDLSGADIAAWRELIAANPAFESPLLSPDFALAVGRVRRDARVAVYREQGRAVAFLPHQRRPGGIAKAIGAPLGDYQALIRRPDLDLDLAGALKLAGLPGMKLCGLVDPFAHGGGLQATPAYAVRLEGAAEDYLEAIRTRSPKRFKNWRRLDHALEREVGSVSLRAPDRDQASFETMLAWKRDQLARTNGYDFLRPAWVQTLLRNLFEGGDGELQGLMIGLYAGETLAAVHFGVRQGGAYHPWIASANPDLADYSPGQIFLWRAIGAMPGLGLSVYDMGPSHDHYKRHYCLREPIPVGTGMVGAAGSAGAVARASEAAWALAGAQSDGFAARLRRRLDIIDSVETSFEGRLRGLAQAALMQARRKPSSAYV